MKNKIARTFTICLVITSLVCLLFSSCIEAPLNSCVDSRRPSRGDIDLDGLDCTIADAVMLSNYFVHDTSALISITEIDECGNIPYYDWSIAASDINCDGQTSSVADLVTLLRIVIYDEQGCRRVTPTAANLIVGNTLSVDAEMGAAFVVLAGDQNPTNLTGMDMKVAFDGVNTRVLLWDVDGATFDGEFLGNVGNVISTELAGANGATVKARSIPKDFGLGQNYPNPFNPTTAIELALQNAGDYTLTIYNVTGQVVETFSGSADAGFVTVNWDASSNASGVYFYKLTAGNFTETKKMVLLK